MGKRGRFGSLLCAAFAVASAALIGATGLGSAALAQTAGTAGPVTINDLFTGDGVDLNPSAAQRLADAARKAQAPGECPLGRLTINTPAGDQTFQDALGAARRDAVLAFLDRQGIKASRFFADVKVGGTQSNVRLDYNVARDDIAPTLDVQWTPPKGTKVRVGTRITAKVIAKDDANRWQSGIKTIDLDVQGGGQFGFGDYPQLPQTCESPPPPRTLEGVHTVPANPPPLVRLHAIAKDYAGNETDVWAEFPTGDWYGQIKWSQFSAGGEGHYGTLDIAVVYDEHGNLTGRAVGEDHLANNSCAIIISTPARTSAKVVGQYTPGANTMSLQFSESEQMLRTMGVFNCPEGGMANYYPVAASAGMGGVLNNLTVSATGSVDAERVRQQGETTLRVSLKLRRAQN